MAMLEFECIMSKLRDKLLEDALPASEYFKLENHKHSKGLGIKSEAKSIKVPPDPYETGKLENDVRKDVNRLLKTYGFISRTIYTGGIPAGTGKLVTNPAKGIADQLVTHPIRKSIFWIELKKNEGGLLSPEQQTFKWDMENSGIDVFIITSAQLLEAELKRKNLI